MATERICRWTVVVSVALCLMASCSTARQDLSGGYGFDRLTMFQMMRKFAAEHPAEMKTVVGRITDRLGPEGQRLRADLMAELVKPMAMSTCQLCKTLFRVLKIWARLDTMENILNSALDACILLANAMDHTQTVQAHILCPGTIAIQGPHVYKIITKVTTFPTPFCETVNGCYNTSAIVPGWPAKSSASASKPAATAAQKLGQSEHLVRPAAIGDTIKIAQLTDIHIEQDYKENTHTDCGLPVCCQEIYGPGKAGYWGHYKCNVPTRTARRFLEQIRDDIQPNYIIFSGDIPPHTLWEETAASQLNCSQSLVALMTDVFENTTRILPALGNHEMYPTNLFSMKYNNETRPLISSIVDTWSTIARLGDTEISSMKTNGFYSTILQTQGTNNIRLIALNSVFMYTANFYNVLNYFGMDFNPIDTSSETNAYKSKVELALQQARRDDEKVILVGHHVLGSSDYTVREARWFENLVSNYSDIIILIVAGHTHGDEFRLFSKPSDINTVVSTQFVCPSIDAQGYVNPSVRVYEFSNQFVLNDYTQYFYNLSTSTGVAEPEPTIVKLYSAKDAYGLTNLTAASWLDLLNRMANDQALLEKHRRYESAGASSTGNFACDATCRLNYLCKLRYASYDRYDACTHQYDVPATTVPTITRPTLPILTGQPALDATPVPALAPVTAVGTQWKVLLLAAAAVYWLFDRM